MTESSVKLFMTLLQKNNDAMVEEILTDKYFGMLQGANIEIAYYRSYPGAVLKSLWTASRR